MPPAKKHQTPAPRQRRSSGCPLSPKQLDFVEWLVTPKGIREPSNQAEWAAQNHVHPTTLTKWRKELDFRKVWDERLTELQVDPENIDEVMTALVGKAKAGDTKAIGMYMDIVKQFRPAPEVDPASLRQPLTELTDEQLAAMVAEHAAAELADRSADASLTPS